MSDENIPSKRIHFFENLAEENEEVYRIRASKSGAENLAEALVNIKKVYAEQIKNYKPDYRIHFHD